MFKKYSLKYFCAYHTMYLMRGKKLELVKYLIHKKTEVGA